MTQSVKLHILPPNFKGFSVGYAWTQNEDGTITTDAGPRLRFCDGSKVGMVLHNGTLHTNTSPDQWQPVDVDRAAALGYGPSDPWPFPDRIETPRIAFNSVTDAMMSQQHQTHARRNKVGLLNTHILPKYGALLTDKAVRVVEAKTNRTTMLDFYEFDALTIGQLVHRIQTRLK